MNCKMCIDRPNFMIHCLCLWICLCLSSSLRFPGECHSSLSWLESRHHTWFIWSFLILLCYIWWQWSFGKFGAISCLILGISVLQVFIHSHCLISNRCIWDRTLCRLINMASTQSGCSFSLFFLRLSCIIQLLCNILLTSIFTSKLLRNMRSWWKLPILSIWRNMTCLRRGSPDSAQIHSKQFKKVVSRTTSLVTTQWQIWGRRRKSISKNDHNNIKLISYT